MPDIAPIAHLSRGAPLRCPKCCKNVATRDGAQSGIVRYLGPEPHLVWSNSEKKLMDEYALLHEKCGHTWWSHHKAAKDLPERT